MRERKQHMKGLMPSDQLGSSRTWVLLLESSAKAKQL